MAIKRFAGKSGTLVVLQHESKVLKDNLLGDPHQRKLAVWLPPQYDTGAAAGKSAPGRRFPVLFDLVGFTGSGLAHTGWRPFADNVPERVARLIHERKMGPAILVFPDCFTALGGNQYVNSSAIGNYADYLSRELIPFVDREFHTLGSRDHRGCFGKSSGGYGAIIHGMKYAQHWGAIADDGRVKRFLDNVWGKEKLSHAEGHCIMNVCMAATYDPDPRVPLGFRLPFNLETGELIEKRWRRWLEHDPILLVNRYKANLKSLKGIYIDCGWRDQYHIHYGTRVLSKRLAEAGVRHTYEEFDDNHSDIDYRMDVSLPFLYRALKP